MPSGFCGAASAKAQCGLSEYFLTCHTPCLAIIKLGMSSPGNRTTGQDGYLPNSLPAGTDQSSVGCSAGSPTLVVLGDFYVHTKAPGTA